MISAQQWLDEQKEKSTDYPLLIARLRSGEKVECLINLKSGCEIAIAEFTYRTWSDLFDIKTNAGQDLLRFVGEQDFIRFCVQNSLMFAQKDFLNTTRRLLELARDAAEFKAVMVPLNSIEDVDALLALMGVDNAG